jgi:hypothetical protein
MLNFKSSLTASSIAIDIIYSQEVTTETLASFNFALFNFWLPFM